MMLSIKLLAFSFAVSTTSAVAPARDALTMGNAPAVASSVVADAELPIFAIPKVAGPATDALLEEGDLLTGPEPEPVEEPALVEQANGNPFEAVELASLSLPELVDQFAGTQPRTGEMDCLARAIYFETRGEPLHGQLAVGEVIANRRDSQRFPDSYCGVVKQHRQFSFVRGGRLPEPRRSSQAWRTAVAIARIVDAEHHSTSLDGALFFHARYVNPRWRLKRLGNIGNHIFYQ
ncbi:cell wall hydrolase [Sphingomicrobium sp. XHP0239]|uniref:cell wall hydrolase n=1 Tax=Sphingomicrobium maritimum TaxID=3133972 RepID=UPI0031CC9396